MLILSMLRYIIISLLCVLGVNGALGQQSKQKPDSVIKSSFRSLRVEFDLTPAINQIIYKGDRNSFEAAVSANFNNKYFPIVELGYGKANVVSESQIAFNSKGIYSRIGVDLSLLKQQKDAIPTNNLFFVGIRFAFSPVTYNYGNITVGDGYWGGSVVQNYQNQHSFAKWYEVVGGLRVEVFKNVYMGWTVRLKNYLGKQDPGEIYPWYIPGFGVKGDTANFGANYIIGYKF